ncbi:hypothetical protein HDU84_002556 [Entophlyctis sp. JEL0112]|nr:hypothetical protein HDU84_002556 [Entophlyctis sp. JEL0112]
MADIIQTADYSPSQIYSIDKQLASRDERIGEIGLALSNPQEAWENLDPSIRLLYNNDILKLEQALQTEEAALLAETAALLQKRTALILAQLERLIAESGPRYLTTHAILEMTFPPVEMHNFPWSPTTTSSISQKYPMPPLVLAEWSTFETEAWNLTKEIPDIPLIRRFDLVDSKCRSEADVQALADFTLFAAVSILHKTILPEFDYLSPGSFSRVHGIGRVLGDPDRIWLTEELSPSKITIEFKAPWDLAEVQNLIESYNAEYKELSERLTEEKGKVTRAIEQVYVYMTMNRHRYAVLSTLDKTWFFRKVEDETLPNQSRIEISPAVSSQAKQPLSITRAWMFILMNIERNANWLYASSHSSQVVFPSFSPKHKIPKYTL